MVVQDYRAAFNWIEKPAQRGYAKAQYSLGELHRYGTGTVSKTSWMTFSDAMPSASAS